MMEELSRRRTVRLGGVLIGLVLLALCLGCRPAAQAEEPQAGQVLIRLEEDIPGNAPYQKDGRTYSREIAVPLLNGARGILYKRTSQVAYWLFPLCRSEGTPVLTLSLEGIKDPTTVSLNDALLTAGEPVAVPLDGTSELRVANERSRGVIRILFTTLPVIELNVDGKVSQNRGTDCTIRVFDPDYRAHGLSEPFTSYEGAVSKRGRTSARYSAKHPYNFSLMRDGRKWDQGLLGLRVDSDWLLDSAYNDRSRMRNRVLMDLWHDMYRLPWDRTLSGATRGVFTEVFINGAYRGLFVLGEKQDRRQLGLARAGGRWHSQFFRTTETGKDSASPAGFVSLGREMPEDDEPAQWYNVDLRYTSAVDPDYGAEWADFYQFVRLAIKGSREELAEGITRYADLENLARYWLLINAMDITDNMRKNMTFVRLDDRDERFSRFIVVPWDMDASLGRYYTAKKSKTNEMMSNRLFSRLIGEDTCQFREILRRTWQDLRGSVMTVDGLMARFERYYEGIAACGADLREQEKYPTFDSWHKPGYHFKLNIRDELKYIRGYLTARFEWMDGRVAALCDGTYIMPQRKD